MAEEYNEDLRKIIETEDGPALINLLQNLANAAMSAMCRVIEDPELKRHCTADEILMGYAAQQVSQYYADRVRKELAEGPAKAQLEAVMFTKEITKMMKEERKRAKKKT